MVKLYRNDLRGNKNYFELAGGSSYRGFELSGVNCNEHLPKPFFKAIRKPLYFKGIFLFVSLFLFQGTDHQSKWASKDKKCGGYS